ncbi:MAG: ferredoxin [Flavobacteriales bacterium]|nr:ferredoxin [Flavobacteriales bacterium]MBQ8649859.1 ferredoxin [Flavobacteriales bacterium]
MPITITLHREKCIGCAYCSQVAGEYFEMSSIDGKSNLIGGIGKKGFFTLRSDDDAIYPCSEAMKNCPVRIIKVVKR